MSGPPIFGGEDNVIKEIGEGLRHCEVPFDFVRVVDLGLCRRRVHNTEKPLVTVRAMAPF